ncbi:hypothetical protein EG327_007455 [Venturia inaequalis]|uniref:DNA (cytosine-5-)-methyltransferase n=1 Tax=Venturia inaequalis TaxID=5025 RepID=A0A8H3V002_VENIN|nr:hypothetical protein EG327_007455 [Venturia inaequalis]
MARSSNSPTVDLTDDDDDLFEGEVSLIDSFFDLTMDSDDDSEAIIIDSDEEAEAINVKDFTDEDEKSPYQQTEHLSVSKRSRRKQELRNAPVSHPFEVLDHWPEPDLRPGMCVELKSKDGKDGDFVRIHEIIINNSKEHDNILIRGLPMRRAKYVGGFAGPARLGGQTVGGKMKRDLNELAFVFQMDKDDPRPPREQALVTFSLSDVLHARDVVFTIEEFPRRSFRETTVLKRTDPNYDVLKQSVKEAGVLVCRWSYTDYFEDARHRLSKHRRSREGCLRRLWQRESDFPSPPQTGLPQPSKPARQNNGPIKKKKFTYGSGCCGAGGDSEGARMAGMTVKYAWDFDESACTSFGQNHPNAKIYYREASEFPVKGEDDSCDHLHLSWPCDYFSPNHTCEGKNDDANISAIFGTYQKLMSAKPRIHTQENTFGIDSHHPEFMGAVIQEIVRAGYNVRWKVDQFADYGLPASRNRVVIIAARIGVPLPEFPKATHGPPGSGLASYRTVRDAISKIPVTASWHLDYQSPYAISKPAYDARTAKSSCITRNGGNRPHPSGKRPFTPREMASLQGFPDSYAFVGSGVTEVRKQIGNAIPPNVWKHYVKSCVDTLERFDGGLIDETGQLIKSEETVKREEAGSSSRFSTLGSSSRFSTPSRQAIKPEKKRTSSSTTDFNTPSGSKTSSVFSGPSTSSSQSSVSNRSLYRMSPSPAPRHRTTRAFTEDYMDLSPEPFELAPAREASTFGPRPSPFKRKIEPIDLTGERKKMKVKKKEMIDLTGDDWEMIDDSE